MSYNVTAHLPRLRTEDLRDGHRVAIGICDHAFTAGSRDLFDRSSDDPPSRPRAAQPDQPALYRIRPAELILPACRIRTAELILPACRIRTAELILPARRIRTTELILPARRIRTTELILSRVRPAQPIPRFVRSLRPAHVTRHPDLPGLRRHPPWQCCPHTSAGVPSPGKHGRTWQAGVPLLAKTGPVDISQDYRPLRVVGQSVILSRKAGCCSGIDVRILTGDGYQACRWLRDHHRRPDTQIGPDVHELARVKHPPAALTV